MEVVAMPPQEDSDVVVRLNIGSALEQYNRTHGRGHLSHSSGTDGGRAAVFWGFGRVPADRDLRAYPATPPDLIVQVPPPGARRWEVVAQLREYFAAGVRLVWVVAPDDREVTVYTRPGGGTVLWEDDTVTGGDVLPGFTCPVAEFFRGVPATE